VAGKGDELLFRVLDGLARGLSDAAIADAVPGVSPVVVRERLVRLAARFRPETGEPRKEEPGTAAPRAGRAVLHTDGASRGNPGEAGAGAALYGPGGGEIGAWRWYLGRTTNNAAEYLALVHGLEEALKAGVDELEVRMDSELVVRQLNGRYRVRNAELQRLFARVQELRRRFRKVTFTHVRRGENRRADQLANQAIDRKDG
jgi:ribonuclease HI